MVGDCSGLLSYLPEEDGRYFPTILHQSLILPDVTDGQTIEKVHQDDHNQEDEGEEVKIAERHQVALSVYWNIAELEFTHKHCERFGQCEEGIVEERLKSLILPLSCVGGNGGIIRLQVLSKSLENNFLTILVAHLVQHDVKSQTEGNNVEDVPEQEEGECLENIVEHRDVDVVPGQVGMFGYEGDELCPGEKETDAGQLFLQLVVFLIRSEQDDEY